MKLILKISSFFLLIISLLVIYLSTIGIETDRFNKQIQKQIENIDRDLILNLKQVKLTLNPLDLNISAKTLGPKIIKQNKSLSIESIITSIPLKSLFNEEFLIEKIEISTKSIEIDDLTSFLKSIYKIPEIIILKRLLNIQGYLIADIKLEFDKIGKVKENYIIKGFVKDTKLNLSKHSNINKLNFIFQITKDDFNFEDLRFKVNDHDIYSKNIAVKKNQNEYFVKGEIENDIIDLNKEERELLKNITSFEIALNKIKFSSKNDFSFKIDNKMRFKDTNIISKINLDEAKILKNFDLKKIFPELKSEISIIDNKIDINYKENSIFINGNGNILFQKTKDFISYEIEKKKDKLFFNSLLKTKENPFLIKFLNFEKNIEIDTSIKIDGYQDKNTEFFIKSASIIEENNKIEIKNIHFEKNYRIKQFDEVNLDYLDKDKQKNLIKINKVEKNYFLKGNYFNADTLIDNILFDDSKNSYFPKDFKLNIDIKKIRLDEEFQLSNLNGNLNFKDQKLFNGKLEGDFRNNKKLNFTVNTKKDTKTTTLFLDYAKPIVKRYSFIKGFDEGVLDFYSSKNGKISQSTLKIYDFKLKELPTLTKILTLASLQGIADILSGEGIRFNEFEMNFKNKENLMTIDEIYAIGPAISVLMNGYVEKDKLISLRGTLVPATTINKAIGSIPVLGKILVGSKTGEGVFGVSFKIKGPPKNLSTSVNPIKTLTPRFITRTLEKIKKSN